MKEAILEQIAETHVHFSRAMERRLGGEELEDVERYFAMLSRLVDKLDDDDKQLKEIMQEMAMELAPLLMS